MKFFNKQLLALLSEAKLLLSPDAGPAHMAVTVNTPVVGLYAHQNPKRTGPYYYRKYAVDAFLDELKAQYGKTPEEMPLGTKLKGKDLMDKISLEQVKDKVDLILNDYYPALP